MPTLLTTLWFSLAVKAPYVFWNALAIEEEVEEDCDWYWDMAGGFEEDEGAPVGRLGGMSGGGVVLWGEG